MTEAEDKETEINIVPHEVGRLCAGLLLGPLLLPHTFSRWGVDLPSLVYSLLGSAMWAAFIWMVVTAP